MVKLHGQFPLKRRDLTQLALLYGVRRRWFESDGHLRDRMLYESGLMPCRRMGESDAEFRQRLLEQRQ